MGCLGMGESHNVDMVFRSDQREENLAETQPASALFQKGEKNHHKSGSKYVNWKLEEKHPLDGRAGEKNTEIWPER